LSAPAPSLERSGTGLEFLQQIVAGTLGNIPIADHLGYRITAVSKGHVELRGTPGENTLNLMGTVHGGYAAAVLDTALALSIVSTLDADTTSTTLEIKVSYIRPILAGVEIFAVGDVLNAGRRVATSEARIVDAQGKLLAHGTTTCLVFPRHKG
jgi:uncharacterized protein (TIGR00369 family)